MACDTCPLKGSKVVQYLDAERESGLLIVGESPGRNEVSLGVPFIGASGQLLANTMAKAGLNMRQFHITNSAKCMMDKEFKKSTKAVRQVCASCREYLEARIKSASPKVILLAGAIALKQVMKQSNITNSHGVIQWSDEFDCWVMATIHPSYCLRFPQYQPMLLEDLTKLYSFISSGYQMDQRFVSTKVINSIDDVPGLLEAQYVAIDSETQGADPHNPNGLVISYSFAFSHGEGYHVLLHEEVDPTKEKPDFTITWERKIGRSKFNVNVGVKRSYKFKEKLDLLRHILESDIKKFMFNGNFDIMFFNSLFLRAGLEKPRLRNYIMDVQAAAHLLEENIYSRCSLEQARKGLTTFNTDYSLKFDANQDKSDMLTADPDDLARYAALDAVVTYKCGMEIRDRLNKREFYLNPFAFKNVKDKQYLVNYLTNFTMPVLDALRVLEENGAMVLVDQIETRREEISRLVVDYSERAINLIPMTVRKKHMDKGVRLSRTDLIRDTLFSPFGFGLKSENQTAAGAMSVDKTVRKGIFRSVENGDARQFLENYELWAEYSVLLSRYIKQFEESVKNDNRIHPRYSIASTVTGRTAASQPSIQNFPKRSSSSKMIRSLLGAPDGHVLLAFDQAQAELRWAAQLSGDANMINAYISGSDLHTKTAEALLGKKKDDVDPDEFKDARRSAKSANFGLLYGMGAPKFRDYARNEYNLELTMEEAVEYRNVFFGTYPELEEYHKFVEIFSKRHGYIMSPFGRIRRVPEVNSMDFQEANRAIRQAINFPIQSASSDTVLLALVHMLRQNLLDPNLIRPIVFIHDDLTFECVDKPDVIDYYVGIIRGAMENPPIEELFGLKMMVPLKSDTQIGYNLAEMSDYEG